MSENISAADRKNRLFDFSLKRPGIIVFCLFLMACVFKYIDNFALRLDELLGEAILTKAAGLLLVFLYLLLAGKKMRDIGFHKEQLSYSLLISGLGFIVVYFLAFIVQYAILRSSGVDARPAISAMDPKTGMTGGILFGIWMIAANLVNSAMEEGLFRGIMMRHLKIKMSGWGALLVSSAFFAIWHLGWPIRHYLDGVPMNEVAMEAATLLLATFIAGLAYGYLYLKTNNLWAPFLAHTINNTLLNMLFFKDESGMQAAYSSMVFMGIVLIGYLVLIPVINWAAKKHSLPLMQAWGSQGE